jgi:hypothetical protein
VKKSGQVLNTTSGKTAIPDHRPFPVFSAKFYSLSAGREKENRLMHRFLRYAGGLFVAAMLLIPSVASAYRFAPGYPRWSFKDMPIKFYVTYTNSGSDWGGRSQQQVEKMVKNAIEMWNQSSCHSVVLKFGGTTKLLAGEKDGKNVITWVGGLPGVT